MSEPLADINAKPADPPDGLAVLFRHTEHCGDHLDREIRGEVGNHVERVRGNPLQLYFAQ